MAIPMEKSAITRLRVSNRVGRRVWKWQAIASENAHTHSRSGKTFTFRGKSLPYLQASYNYTWRNERTVEIPIFRDIIASCEPSQVLEIGNVLSNYIPSRHTVVDKYEVAPGVQNIDIVEFDPGRTYDLIIAISTLEHVGWDEEPMEPSKVRRAIDHLRRLLSPEGKLTVSFPLGYNSEVNALLAQEAVPWATLTCLKRSLWENTWREATWREVAKRRYDYWTPTARAIVVGTVGRAE